MWTFPAGFPLSAYNRQYRYLKILVKIGQLITDSVGMRVFRIVSLLAFFTVPVSVFAQQTGAGTSTAATSSINTEFGSTYQGVANVSEQAATQGSFVGSGRPTGFVGIDEFFVGSSNSSRTSSNPRRQTTTVRPATRSTTQRQSGMMPSVTRSTSGNANQFVRAVTSIDFDVATLSLQKRRATAETVALSLNRIQGIQNSQVTFKDSPAGTTAVLTGTVVSERDRRVAQQLLLLEPGIDRVENLLEIR